MPELATAVLADPEVDFTLARSIPREHEEVVLVRAVVEHAGVVLHVGARGPDLDCRALARAEKPRAEVERAGGVAVAGHHGLAVLERHRLADLRADCAADGVRKVLLVRLAIERPAVHEAGHDDLARRGGRDRERSVAHRDIFNRRKHVHRQRPGAGLDERGTAARNDRAGDGHRRVMPGGVDRKAAGAKRQAVEAGEERSLASRADVGDRNRSTVELGGRRGDPLLDLRGVEDAVLAEDQRAAAVHIVRRDAEFHAGGRVHDAVAADVQRTALVLSDDKPVVAGDVELAAGERHRAGGVAALRRIVAAHDEGGRRHRAAVRDGEIAHALGADGAAARQVGDARAADRHAPGRAAYLTEDKPRAERPAREVVDARAAVAASDPDGPGTGKRAAGLVDRRAAGRTAAEVEPARLEFSAGEFDEGVRAGDGLCADAAEHGISRLDAEQRRAAGRLAQRERFVGRKEDAAFTRLYKTGRAAGKVADWRIDRRADAVVADHDDPDVGGDREIAHVVNQSVVGDGAVHDVDREAHLRLRGGGVGERRAAVGCESVEIEVVSTEVCRAGNGRCDGKPAPVAIRRERAVADLEGGTGKRRAGELHIDVLPLHDNGSPGVRHRIAEDKRPELHLPVVGVRRIAVVAAACPRGGFRAVLHKLDVHAHAANDALQVRLR